MALIDASSSHENSIYYDTIFFFEFGNIEVTLEMCFPYWERDFDLNGGISSKLFIV